MNHLYDIRDYSVLGGMVWIKLLASLMLWTTGSLISLLQNGLEFVFNNSKKQWKKISDSRIEMPDYPERSVKEGLVNALIHGKII